MSAINQDPLVCEFLPVTPAVEIGWRLASKYWGRGYATKAAKAIVDFAFTTLKLEEVVSFTVENNIRSRRVMDKIGMRHNPKDDFDHPKLPKNSPLCRHILYQLVPLNNQKLREL